MPVFPILRQPRHCPVTAAWRSMGLLALGCALSLGAATAQAQTLAQALEQAQARHPLAVSFAARQGEALARAEAARALTPALKQRRPCPTPPTASTATRASAP
ncbi:MAG: hypothetical protein IPO19_11970 [Rhodoferax sp.]|nr:hypothetical protein [Rhodoferax sp.]